MNNMIHATASTLERMKSRSEEIGRGGQASQGILADSENFPCLLEKFRSSPQSDRVASLCLLVIEVFSAGGELVFVVQD